MKRLFLLAVCALALIFAISCNEKPEETADTTAHETAEEETTLSAGKIEKSENAAYLAGVKYQSFELTEDGNPYYVGRWFEKEIDGKMHHVTLTDGSFVCFLTDGASRISISFTAIHKLKTPYFSYSIDGNTPIRQLITEPDFELPDAGKHTVRVIADGLTESEKKWKGEVGYALEGITADAGKIIGIKPTGNVIYFYGDSITEGIRALNMNADSDGNSATNAYSWICAEKLGAVPYIVGYGATGIIQAGSFNTMLKAIDYLSYGRETTDNQKPDLIVINHGANDGSTASAKFRTKLKETLTRLCEKYPGVEIIYLIPFAQTHAEDIRAVASEFENISVVETADWDLSYTDGLHPDVAGAEKAGQKLADAIAEKLK